MPTRRARILRLEAYLLIVIMTAFGFWKINNQQEEIERNRVQASTRICEVVNGISDIIEETLKQASINPRPSDTTEERQRRLDQYERVRKQLKPLRCREVVRPTKGVVN